MKNKIILAGVLLTSCIVGIFVGFHLSPSHTTLASVFHSKEAKNDTSKFIEPAVRRSVTQLVPLINSNVLVAAQSYNKLKPADSPLVALPSPTDKKAWLQTAVALQHNIYTIVLKDKILKDQAARGDNLQQLTLQAYTLSAALVGHHIVTTSKDTVYFENKGLANTQAQIVQGGNVNLTPKVVLALPKGVQFIKKPRPGALVSQVGVITGDAHAVVNILHTPHPTTSADAAQQLLKMVSTGPKLQKMVVKLSGPLPITTPGIDGQKFLMTTSKYGQAGSVDASMYYLVKDTDTSFVFIYLKTGYPTGKDQIEQLKLVAAALSVASNP